MSYWNSLLHLFLEGFASPFDICLKWLLLKLYHLFFSAVCRNSWNRESYNSRTICFLFAIPAMVHPSHHTCFFRTQQELWTEDFSPFASWLCPCKDPYMHYISYKRQTLMPWLHLKHQWSSLFFFHFIQLSCQSPLQLILCSEQTPQLIALG